MPEAVPETSTRRRLLLLPGWTDSEASHWQSRWETLHGCQRVVQDDWLWPRRGDWMARLDEVLLQSDLPAVLIAHSLGCHLVAAWAAHSSHTHRVEAALLVAMPDTERADMPANLFNWRPVVRRPLPFPSVAAVSSDDPYCSPQRAHELALDWGCSLVDLGRLGHVNAASGLGDWPEGWRLLESLVGRSSTITRW